MKRNTGAELVSRAILNTESKTVLVGGKPYFIKPPTIKIIAAVGLALSDYGSETGTFADVLKSMTDTPKAAKALSYFIKGDDTLTDELCERGTPNEVVNALAEGISLLGIKDFQMLSDLSRSVQRLIANPR